jgi:hypothetical protein
MRREKRERAKALTMVGGDDDDNVAGPYRQPVKRIHRTWFSPTPCER